MKNIILLSVIAVMTTACATRSKILDTQGVSMTKAGLDKGQKVKPMGAVDGKFCMNSFNDKGELGLMDEAVKDAQTKSGADYITDASFWLEGSNCVVVEGTGQKVVN